MELYPAIDLRGGRCVRLYQGDFAQETVYGDDPVAQARRFADAGAPWVHVVDLDASRAQGDDNREVVVAIARAVGPTPVQTGGGVRDGSLLADGVARVVLGSLAIADRGAAGRLVTAHPKQVAIGLDHRDGEIRTRGWEEASGVGLLDAVAWPEFAGAAAFVVTNIARDATLEGPDIEGLRAVMDTTAVPVVASGGVGSLADLEALRSSGVAGVIVGKALYEGRFTIEEAIAECSR
ncbi:MAG: phosphoribosylformimino-5-aminoimidazole carboxamide ribotide isomerase [Actinomycetota bacterium]|jgi:phosphoribosylformimino-5-aminoimidazole carboxamide ribotide isomerase|nr:phosphoribosylformimino-5-aminoimidazole carboxamide ribotide isomerase [Actinomycetota bacterium]